MNFTSSNIEHPEAYNRAIKRNIIANAKVTFERTHADYDAILTAIDEGRVYDDYGSVSYTDKFMGSMASAYDTYGKLTEGQVNAIRKGIAARAARKAEWADERAALNAVRTHLGTVGEKGVTMTLTVVHIVVMESAFGTNYLHICEDVDKNVVIYKGNASGFPVKGETATIKATIKEHGVRDGVKQTVIQRPKVI
ncbi:hypothetical protein UFOVP764_40 [uncultured Caudovirales phage]|uniref:Uncharacterized protein n=1 Tax=uncultured Caudovirales phage TaxID=2100421 RepID=A0A6J5NPJ4_9CAUD|nr:hypothetical protein UFOVP764_40 [uncultured Caudovirales phage]